MKINSLITNSYRSNNRIDTKKSAQKMSFSPEVKDGRLSLKRQLQEAGNADKNKVGLGDYNKYLKSTMSYGETLRAQREKAQTASLEKKKLKYAFKDISSQIVSSKTSVAARKAVGQARRELMRLQKEKATGKYDPEEIEAAIAHAKAMERVAKKKVKHLEEEEMARAAAGPFIDIEEREEDNKEEFNVDDLKESSEGNPDEAALADGIPQEEYAEEAYYEEAYYADAIYAELPDISELDFLSEISAALDEMDMQLSDMEELTSEMMDEMTEGLQDMLEEMGFGEMTESVKAASGDMDPEDLKMMKIKHRCKEMKEMAKADSEYLKAVFKQLAEGKGAGGPVLGGNGGAVTKSSPVATQRTPSVAIPRTPSMAAPTAVDVSTPAEVAFGGAFAEGTEGATSTIDISL